MIKRVFAILIALVVMCAGYQWTTPVSADEPVYGPAVVEGDKEYTITSPYASVDWVTYGQFKTALHVHSKENGGADEPAAVVEDHYAKGYNVMALTDHDFVNTTLDRTDRPARTYLTTARLNEIKAGLGRANIGLEPIPFAIEQTVTENINTYFVDFRNEYGSTIEENIAAAEKGGGISQINHPGRYTGGANGGTYGAQRSSEPFFVSKYASLYLKYPSCFAMEIINKKDGDSASDRILWDNVLQRTLPTRNVWATSNDDTHEAVGTGFSFDMLLMPSNNLTNIRAALTDGTFYAVAKVAKRELGAVFEAIGDTPELTGVSVDQTAHAITIAADHYNKIEWVADGKVIATGNTIDLNYYETKVNKYVRAQIKGAGGIAFVQPFAVQDLSTLKKPTIRTVTDATTQLRGMAEKGVKIIIEADRRYVTYSDPYFGTWTCNIPTQLTWSVIRVQERKDIRSSAYTSVTVYPRKPYLKQPVAGYRFVQGNSSPYARILIRVNGKLFSNYAQNNGDFSVYVKKLRAKQTVTCQSKFLERLSAKTSAIVVQ